MGQERLDSLSLLCIDDANMLHSVDLQDRVFACWFFQLVCQLLLYCDLSEAFEIEAVMQCNELLINLFRSKASHNLIIF